MSNPLAGKPIVTSGVYSVIGVDADGGLVRTPGIFNSLVVKDEAGTTQFRVQNNYAATNNWIAQAGISGSGPVLVPEGTDTNINAYIAAKGAGTIEWGNGNGGIISVEYHSLNPFLNGDTSLGKIGKAFSHVSLASGTNINFASGNVAHSLNTLTFSVNTAVFSNQVQAVSFFADGAAGTGRVGGAMTDGDVRWIWGANANAESGTNQGSDFFIGRYADDGSYLGNVLIVLRDTGVLQIPQVILNEKYSAAEISDATHGVNLTGKLEGRLVWDTTNHRMMRANGANATSIWYVIDGSAFVTPA
jgi:hypothetical protein